MATSPYPFLSFQPNVNWRKVNGQLLSKLNALGRARHTVITVTSGYRSYEQQKALYERYIRSGKDIRYIAAPPGRSNHNHGQAVDAVVDGTPIAQAFGAAWLRRFGLAAPVKGDPVHVELSGARASSGGYEEDDSGSAVPVETQAAPGDEGPRPALDLGLRPTPIAPVGAGPAGTVGFPGSADVSGGFEEDLPETWRRIASVEPEAQRYLTLAETMVGMTDAAR